MAGRLRAYGRFVRALVGLNLRGALEYRMSFITNVLFMAINDSMWIIFWTLFFARFPVLRGWELTDIVTMWGVIATGFGLATGVFGNCRPEGVRVIVEGRLDYHLSLPKSPLLHYLLGSISVTAWGDVLFGVAAYVGIAQPDMAHFALFVLFALNVCLIFTSFGLLVNSIAFYAGCSESLGTQITNALLSFSTYPLDLFSTGVKVLLFAAIPAGFVSYLPVRLLRDFNWPQVLAVQGFSIALALLAIWVFHRGLRRYESGNLVMLRA